MPRVRTPPPKLLFLIAIAVVILGLAAFAINREGTNTAAPALTQQPAQPARPPLTAAEEKYIRELWPIHGDVERSTLKVTLGQIFYLTKDMPPAELGTRAEEALATYRAAETRLGALQPPPSLKNDHDEYLAAVRLFLQSTAEVLKTVADGKEEHLQAAYPTSQTASDKIREVGGKFWPHEFPAH